MLLALIVAVDDLQEEAGERDELAVWSREEALQQAVAGLVKQNENGQGVLHLERHTKQGNRLEPGCLTCYPRPRFPTSCATFFSTSRGRRTSRRRNS